MAKYFKDKHGKQYRREEIKAGRVWWSKYHEHTKDRTGGWYIMSGEIDVSKLIEIKESEVIES